MSDNLITEEPIEFVKSKNLTATPYFGVVFKSYDPLDIKKIMHPLVSKKDYMPVCLAKGVNGYFLFLQVNNTPNNKAIISKIENVYQTFDISQNKLSNVKDLCNLYSLIRQKKLNDEYIDDALKMQDQLYQKFIQLLHSVVI